jgi:hypothetical protein
MNTEGLPIATIAALGLTLNIRLRHFTLFLQYSRAVLGRAGQHN